MDFNSVSWFIYLADVLQTVRHSASDFALLSFGVSVFLGILAHGFYAPGRTRLSWVFGVLSATSFMLIWLWVTLGLVIPSKQTMYMMAASEIGETLKDTDEMQALGSRAYTIAEDSLTIIENYIAEQAEQE